MRDAAGHVESIDLAAQPVVRSFVDTFSLLFSGDRAALERLYASRVDTYRLAHLRVSGSRVSPGVVADRILEALAAWSA